MDIGFIDVFIFILTFSSISLLHVQQKGPLSSCSMNIQFNFGPYLPVYCNISSPTCCHLAIFSFSLPILLFPCTCIFSVFIVVSSPCFLNTWPYHTRVHCWYDFGFVDIVCNLNVHIRITYNSWHLYPFRSYRLHYIVRISLWASFCRKHTPRIISEVFTVGFRPSCSGMFSYWCGVAIYPV